MIGVFDSGLGGLTVLKHFLKELPEYSYIYLGDNARVPYGNKSPELIYNYTCQALDFLFAAGCPLVILACNSASAQALRKVQQEYLPDRYPDRKVLGVVRPLAEYFAHQSSLKKIGVLGTKATILSSVYEKEIKHLNPNLEVFGQSAPLLVPLIEEDFINQPETKTILKKYLLPLKRKHIQALILACTHYPFLQKQIQKIMGRACQVPNPSQIVALSLKDYLSRHPELKLKTGLSIRKYYITDDLEKFKYLGELFLGQRIDDLNKVEL
jgi:glutamate racemase